MNGILTSGTQLLHYCVTYSWFFPSILGVIASMTVQSKGLSPAEILQLIQGSPQQEQIEVEQQSSGSDTEDDVELADVVATALLTKIKHLG